MKKYLINKLISIVKDVYPHYNDEKIAEIKYGLEGLYVTFTKIVVIFIICAFLEILKECVILLSLYNVLRLTAFGLHASKSYACWISSLTVFVLAPYIAINISINYYIKIIISILCIIGFVLYAPADTEKRPLVNKKRRMIYKIITVLNSIIFTVLLLCINNLFLSNALLFAMVIQLVVTIPFTYKFFKLPYNNYKTYSFSNQ